MRILSGQKEYGKPHFIFFIFLLPKKDYGLPFHLGFFPLMKFELSPSFCDWKSNLKYSFMW